MLCSKIKAKLPIAARLQKVIQGVDRIVIVYSIAGRMNCICGASLGAAVACALHCHTVPRGATRKPRLSPAQAGAGALDLPLTLKLAFNIVEAAVVRSAATQPKQIRRAVVIKRAAAFVIRLLVVVLAPVGFFHGGVH